MCTFLATYHDLVPDVVGLVLLAVDDDGALGGLGRVLLEGRLQLSPLLAAGQVRQHRLILYLEVVHLQI